ncbi:MAG: TIGR03087 family PEP-CTERM/XrtA system glycosyltransferase [Candidatus Omnitrophica bacterium]|nr:TIGR03087 family PEP-CTERM/XrtA system glycosyltransferase [Candidatus Omnitrophota bacterium]MCM8791331.1 TIGR03087 family PEP-CTERM/XrtA system glycosyltransferase [Candidatus Omnitrophota bacterium]
MNILMLTHRIPYPPNKGDKLRAYNIMRYLASQHDVCLLSLYDELSDCKYVRELNNICKEVHLFYLNPFLAKGQALGSFFMRGPFTVGYFFHPALKRKVYSILREGKTDRIFAYSSPMAQYVMNAQITKIMDFVDCDSAKWRQYTVYSGFPMSVVYGLENKLLRNYEREIASKFDRLIVVTEKEKDEFARITDVDKFQVIENGVDTGFFTPGPFSEEKRIVFTGAMDYYANIDAVFYFCEEIFPIVRRSHPDAQLYIVGHNPVRAVRSLGKRAGVTVTGTVKDVRDYLRGAIAAIAPMRIAQGIQNKILEAMACGIPVVATSKAAGAVKALPGRDILVSDNPADFARQLSDLIRDKSLRDFIGRSARRFVEEEYSWEKNLSKLDLVIE